MNSGFDRSNVNTAGRAAWVCLGIAWLTFLLPIPGIGFFIGWPLNVVAFILAIVAMSKFGTSGGLMQLLASLIASPIIYFIGIAILGGILAAGANASSTSARTEQSAVISTPASAGPGRSVITAKELSEAYEANKATADAEFKSKILRVTGTIEGIDAGVNDEPTIRLAGATDFRNINATGVDAATASKFKKGQSITLSCTGGGESVGFPSLTECTVK